MILMILMKKFNEENSNGENSNEKINYIALFLEKTMDLTSIHPKMHEIFVSQSFPEKLFLGNM